MSGELSHLIILIRGGGEVASGVAHRLARAHFRVCLTEIPKPLAVSRGTAFSEAVFDGIKTIEGVTAVLVTASPEEIQHVWQQGNIPLVIDPGMSVKYRLHPDVLVDAIMAKRNTGTKLTDAPLVIGLGPGFRAGKDVHVVVETNNSNNLGRVILDGEAEEDTGKPVIIGGLARERVVWAPRAGIFTTNRQLGDRVEIHQTAGWLEGQPVEAPLSGILRGLIRSGVKVAKGTKIIEIDPENDGAICHAIRDKMRAIGGGVLEAILIHFNV